MTNLQKAASEFRKALAHSDKGPGAPRSSIELIEKGEALIEAIEKAQSLAAATACADHEAGETGYATFKTRVAHGAQLFLAPPAEPENAAVDSVDDEVEALAERFRRRLNGTPWVLHDVAREALLWRDETTATTVALPDGRYSVGLVDDGTGHYILLDGIACGGQWSRSDAETIVRALNATLLPCAKRDV